MAPLPRLFAFVCCLGLLSSLFVLGGAGWRESPSAGPVLDIEDPTVELAEHPDRKSVV